MTSAMDLSALEADPRLFLYTSLTAGSSHIITATSRMETILKANKIPFLAIDTATDEKARRLWQRRAGQRKLPGLVKEGFVIGDLEEVEEWNEYDELKENIGPVPASTAAPPGAAQTGVNIAPPLPVNPTATSGTAKVTPPGGAPRGVSKGVPLPGAAEIAARNKAGSPDPIDAPLNVETMSSSPATKRNSISAATKAVSIEHLSVPPSEIPSDTSTPAPEPADPADPAQASTAGGATATHNTSEVKEAPAAETEKGESKTASKETDESKAALKETDEDEASATKAVEELHVSDAAKTQEQSATEGEKAGKSVED